MKITKDQLQEIFDLALMVRMSKQNVGTIMKHQALNVLGIVEQVKMTHPPIGSSKD